MEPIFRVPVLRAFTPAAKAELDRDGHVVLPNLLTDATSQAVRDALHRVARAGREDEDRRALNKLQGQLFRLMRKGDKRQARTAVCQRPRHDCLPLRERTPAQ